MTAKRGIKYRCIDCAHYDQANKWCRHQGCRWSGGSPACRDFKLAELGQRLVRRYRMVVETVRRTFGDELPFLSVEFEGRCYSFEPLVDGRVRIIDLTLSDELPFNEWSEEKVTVGVYEV